MITGNNGMRLHGTVKMETALTQVAKIILHHQTLQIPRTHRTPQTVLVVLHVGKIGLCGTNLPIMLTVGKAIMIGKNMNGMLIIIVVGHNGIIPIGNNHGVIGQNGTLLHGRHQIIIVGRLGITRIGDLLVVIKVGNNGMIRHGTVQFRIKRILPFGILTNSLALFKLKKHMINVMIKIE